MYKTLFKENFGNIFKNEPHNSIGYIELAQYDKTNGREGFNSLMGTKLCKHIRE